MLYSVEMNVSAAFPEGYRDDLALVGAGDFNAPASSEERAWARLSYVMRELEETYTELGALPAVQFGARFAEEYESAASEFRSLRYRMAGYVDERKGGARSSGLGPDHRFKADLRRAFSRAALLLVVLLNLRSRSQEQISAKLHALGFKTGPNAIAEGEVGPDAAVTALVLALVLFVVCPLVTIGVDIAMNEVIGRGFAAPYHDYRYPDLIIYPATILHANGANLATRVPITFVMTFFSLMTLAVVNLTIARRFAGIPPGEMFTGEWLRRPYLKYFRAAFLSAVLCLGSGMLLMYLMVLAGLGNQMTGSFNPLLALIWLAPLFLIALSLQVFAQNRGHSLPQVLGEGLACGLVWAGVSYVATFLFFTSLHEINGKPILGTEVLGAALYSACTGFFIGMPFTALLLFVSKSARAGATQARKPVLVASSERSAA
jgi:hypothetical protein